MLCDFTLCAFHLVNFILMILVWWSGTKTLKFTTANTDIKLSSGGEALHLATLVNEQHIIIFVRRYFLGWLNAPICHFSCYCISKFETSESCKSCVCKMLSCFSFVETRQGGYSEVRDFKL